MYCMLVTFEKLMSVGQGVEFNHTRLRPENYIFFSLYICDSNKMENVVIVSAGQNKCATFLTTPSLKAKSRLF